MVDSFAKYFPDYETKFSEWTIRYVDMSANPDSANSLWSRDSYYILTYIDDSGVEKTMTIRANSQIESRFYVKNEGKVGTQITALDLLIADPNYGTAVNETQGRIWWNKS